MISDRKGTGPWRLVLIAELILSISDSNNNEEESDIFFNFVEFQDG